MINTIETKIIDNNLNHLFYKINDMEKRINRYKDYQFFLENKFMKNELTLDEMVGRYTASEPIDSVELKKDFKNGNT